MSSAVETRDKGVARFRTRLFTAMMIVVATLTALGFYLAQRKVTADAERNLQQIFQNELSSLHKLEELRHAALADRCNALAAKSRIHAAIEDNATDLLYPSAKDELRDLMESEEPPPAQAAQWLHAKFYRFLDGAGAVIKPLNPYEVGELNGDTEAQLALSELPDKQQIGYVLENTQAGDRAIDEVIAVALFSTATGDVISALVIGFKPLELEDKHTGMKSGIWTNGHLHLPALPTASQTTLNEKVADAVAKSDQDENYFRVDAGGAPQLLFYKRLNPGSLFPPAYEICVYPLSYSLEELRRLRWQVSGAGALLLLGGFIASHLIALRFSAPVKKLALDSEENRAKVQSARRSDPRERMCQRQWRCADCRKYRLRDYTRRKYFRAVSSQLDAFGCVGPRHRTEFGTGTGPAPWRRFAPRSFGKRLDRV